MTRKAEEAGLIQEKVRQMRFVLAVPSAAALSLLALNLIGAPFAFLLQGQIVYQWQDDRITALAVLSILTLLFFAVTTKRPGFVKMTASTCVFLSGFVFLLFLVFNYGTNAPDGLLPQLFSVQSAMTSMKVMDAMRLSPVYGLATQTIAWFVALVSSVFVLALPRGVTSASYYATLSASSVLALYGLGVLLVIPQWSARGVVGLQEGTALSWFTNDDLLVVATASIVTLTALRLMPRTRFRRLERHTIQDSCPN
jgi:hypothetical protein